MCVSTSIPVVCVELIFIGKLEKVRVDTVLRELAEARHVTEGETEAGRGPAWGVHLVSVSRAQL